VRTAAAAAGWALVLYGFGVTSLVGIGPDPQELCASSGGGLGAPGQRTYTLEGSAPLPLPVVSAWCVWAPSDGARVHQWAWDWPRTAIAYAGGAVVLAAHRAGRSHGKAPEPPRA
jgi:hypothetical protein